ncbi:MAG: serine/threonine protein kinase [Merismopedia sp. SIO2A8]|nr:serine/threonine protein kinase [Merismopedia sp. SIO2A8]
MLRGKGKAVLIDFGISGELAPTTVSSMHLGHGGFAPIEQSRGDRKPTLDIYCLAATLYYTVTGERPTSSFERKVYDAVLHPPKQLNSTISDRLNQGILKGMALEAKNRPQSMQEWLKLLESPEVLVPPPVKKSYRQEVVRPLSKEYFSLPPRKSDIAVAKAVRTLSCSLLRVLCSLGIKRVCPNRYVRCYTRQTRTIPWISLVGSFMLYLLMGCNLAVAAAVPVAVAGTVAVAVAGTVAVAVAVASLWPYADVLAVPVAVAGTVAMAVAMAWSGVVAGGGAWAVVGAGCSAVATFMNFLSAEATLEKSFSEFHTFLILAGTSILGLVLGWFFIQHSI